MPRICQFLSIVLMIVGCGELAKADTAICIHPIPRSIKQLLLLSQLEKDKAEAFVKTARSLLAAYCRRINYDVVAAKASDMGNGCFLREGRFRGETVYWASCDSARDLDDAEFVRSSQGRNFDHNGSTVVAKETGRFLYLFYLSPKDILKDAGATPGTLLFKGVVDGERVLGTAYRFRRVCGRYAYDVSGTYARGKIVLRGDAPLIGPGCYVTGYKQDILTFE